MEYCSHFPRGSVDWNLSTWTVIESTERSLPSRKCGLKFKEFWASRKWIRSLPSRKCGLKCRVSTQTKKGYVGHFPRGSVDWNLSVVLCVSRQQRHFPRGSVDWNYKKVLCDSFLVASLPSRKCGLKSHSNVPCYGWLCHFPRGSVDWNATL